MLSANVNPEEADKESQGLYCVCSNFLSSELVQYVVDNASPTLANLHNFMERWLANVELWIAHDAKKLGDLSQYQLVLRQNRNALLRVYDDGLHEFYDPRLVDKPLPNKGH